MKRCVAKLTNATGIGLNEIELDNTVLNRKPEVERDGLVRFDQSRRGEDVVCLVKNSISYNWKPNFCINTEIFLSNPNLF